MSNYIIQEILKNRKITDYLASKKIFPAFDESCNKIKYKCPVHEGDNTPSFIVYTNESIENYFCYGCRSGTNIINLYKAIEKCGTAEAIRKLSDGLSIDLDSEINQIIREIESEESSLTKYSPIDYTLLISKQIYDYINLVDKNSEEVEVCERFLRHVDKCLYEFDNTSLKLASDLLTDKLLTRKLAYDKKNNK